MGNSWTLHVKDINKNMTQDMSNKIMTREITQRYRFSLRECGDAIRCVILLLLMVVGVNTAWGQTEEKPADLKAGGYSGTWLRVMETEALPSITSAKIDILFENTK